MRSVLEKMGSVSTKIENNLHANLENYDMLKFVFRDFNEKADESEKIKSYDLLKQQKEKTQSINQKMEEYIKTSIN